MNKGEKAKVKDAVELLDEAYEVSPFLPRQILEARHVLLSLLWDEVMKGEVVIGKRERRFKTYTYTDNDGKKTILARGDIVTYRGRKYRIVEITQEQSWRSPTRRAYLEPLDSDSRRIGIIKKGKIVELEQSYMWGGNGTYYNDWVYQTWKWWKVNEDIK